MRSLRTRGAGRLLARRRVRAGRARLNSFFERRQVAWELLMAALAIVFVLVGFLIDTVPDPEGSVLTTFDWGLTLIFVGEFGVRLGAAYDRRRYLRGHWVDVFAFTPTIHGARLLRFVRLLPLVRVMASTYRALAGVHRLAHHRSVIWLFAAWVTVAMLCTAAMFQAEHGVNPAIHTPIDALWWGIVTLTTVGYGDIVPVTPEGRVAATVLMVLGITLFAAFTGTITSYLVTRAQRDAARGRGPEEGTIPDRLRQLSELAREGLITDDEYQCKRRELLARL